MARIALPAGDNPALAGLGATAGNRVGRAELGASYFPRKNTGA